MSAPAVTPRRARAGRRLAAALRGFARHPGADRWLLVRALLALALAAPALRLLPFRVVSRRLGLRAGEAPGPASPATIERASRIGWAVRAAAARAPWRCSCLAQALAAAFLLRGERIGATLNLGVAKEETGDGRGIAAHAWLRCGEHVLTGGGVRDRYRPLASFEVPDR